MSKQFNLFLLWVSQTWSTLLKYRIYGRVPSALDDIYVHVIRRNVMSMSYKKNRRNSSGNEKVKSFQA